MGDKFESQSFGDGKIEFLTYYSIFGIAQERLIHGMGKRVAQGTGPYLIKFKERDERNQPIKTYFQIDGEYYQVISPKYIKLSLSKDLPQGKIRVMTGDRNPSAAT